MSFSASREPTSERAHDQSTTPLLSVTVTNYNYGCYLERNIESILAQTFDDFELVLIDNGSTDDSLEVMQRYAAQDRRIRIIAHPVNRGLFASLREASDESRGRYRLHLDADDWAMTKDAFQSQIDFLEANPRAAFVYSTMTMVTSEGREVLASHPFDRDIVLAGEDALEAILSFTLNQSGTMMRLDAYRAGPGYIEGVAHVADMWLATKLCEWGDVGYLDRSLYAIRQHDTNLHKRPPKHVVRNEVLPVIEAAFAGPLAAKLADPAAMRRRVVQRALVHLPTQFIFNGHLRTGWRLYWESCTTHPIATIVQFRTLALLARTLLGRQGYEWLRLRAGRTSDR